MGNQKTHKAVLSATASLYLSQFGKRRMLKTVVLTQNLLMCHPQWADLTQTQRENVALLLQMVRLEPQLHP